MPSQHFKLCCIIFSPQLTACWHRLIPDLQQASFKEDGQRVLDAFKSWVDAGAGGASGWALERENHEGWRVAVDEGSGQQGWLLLRASLHDPLLVLNVESDVNGGVPSPCRVALLRVQSE